MTGSWERDEIGDENGKKSRQFVFGRAAVQGKVQWPGIGASSLLYYTQIKTKVTRVWCFFLTDRPQRSGWYGAGRKQPAGVLLGNGS